MKRLLLGFCPKIMLGFCDGFVLLFFFTTFFSPRFIIVQKLTTPELLSWRFW